MHTHGGQSAAPEPPTDGPPEEQVAEPEPVQLVAGQVVLSASERADWLGPNAFAGDSIALDLALTQTAGAVQPRGAHSLLVQVRRQLARIAQQRRDQDRRYREARATGNGSSVARPSSGTVPGHKPRGGEVPADGRPSQVQLANGRLTCGEHDREAADPDPVQRYYSGDPVYAAWCEREALEEDQRALDRSRNRGWVPLRQSQVRQLMGGGPSGSRPAAEPVHAIMARAADLRRAQQREPGHA
jgi:hypothetical protein